MIYTIDQIREKAAPIAAMHHLKELHLFGSYARGEATEASDIDLRITPRHSVSLFEIGEMYADFEDQFQKKLDMITTQGSSESFLQQIRDDEVLLYEG